MKAFALAAIIMVATVLPAFAQVVDDEQRIVDLEADVIQLQARVATLRAVVVTLGSRLDDMAVFPAAITGQPNIILNAPKGTVLFATKTGAFSIDSLAKGIADHMNVLVEQINNHGELHQIMVPNVIKLCLQHPTLCE